jgi:hypothetical protein
MPSPEQAAIVSSATRRHTFRGFEAGGLYFIEALEDRVFVCRNSLNNQTVSMTKPREINYGEQDSTD